MKQLYEQERKNKDYGFEKELARLLYDLIADCDKECERYANSFVIVYNPVFRSSVFFSHF